MQVQETFNWYQNNNPEQSTQKLNLDAAYTYDIEGKMTSANYPSTFSYNQSGQLVTTTGPKYTYSFDAMDRPTGLTDQSNNTDVSSVTYNAANQLLGLSYLGTTETRQYDNLNQMTNLTVGSAMNITYTFPAGTNNGKISQQANSVSGETVTYQYDSLNRLLSASSSQSWSESYGYDGFGNLLSKTPTGGAPTLSQSVNTANNQIVGVTHDANGNQLSGGYGYDAENRLLTAAGIEYGYDSRNKRVWSGATSGSSVTQTVYFYGVDGQRLGIYSFTTPPSALGAPQLSDGAASLAVYFGGKRVGTVTNGATASFAQDRLGSNGGYYPYGEARGTVPQNDVGYATYTNDSATGLQYADQRYYASNWGRFMSPDPYKASVGPSDPQSWNRYAYVRNDPANFLDPRGRDLVSAEDCLVAGEFDASIGCNFGDEELDLNLIQPPGLPQGRGEILSLWRRAAVEAAALWLVVNESRTSTTTSIPTFIKVTKECWLPDSGSDNVLSASYTLFVTYQILNQFGQVMNGPQLSGTSISESISNQIGNAGITPGPPWQYGTNSGIQSNGQFTDLLSSGSFGIVVRSGSFFQSFTASGTIAGVPYSEPLRVIGFGFNTPILDDSVSPNNVTVNGLGLGMNPATKCSN